MGIRGLEKQRQRCIVTECCSELRTMKPSLSDHVWAEKKWPFYRGGLLIGVEIYGIATFGMGPSDLCRGGL
jgi:hypothetical protein